MACDLAVGVDGACVATDLSDFAQDAYGAVRELLEIEGGDAGRCFRHRLRCRAVRKGDCAG